MKTEASSVLKCEYSPHFCGVNPTGRIHVQSHAVSYHAVSYHMQSDALGGECIGRWN